MSKKEIDSEIWGIDTLRDIIAKCQMANHKQQVAYSTYHDCLTQICFTCKKVRTSSEELFIETQK